MPFCVSAGEIMDINKLPLSIQNHVINQPYKTDKVGESDSKVFLFDDMVLKAEKSCRHSDREYEALKWLSGRLSVPEIIAFEKSDGYNYLLMSRIKGKTMIDDIINCNPYRLVEAMADGIKQLWAIDINNCPLDSRLPSQLLEAKYRIDNDLVDTEDFEEDTLGDNGFKSVDDLYRFLINYQPNEDLVFTHGDYCLPNLFVKDNKTIGFIDLGKAGIADRWQDLALCIRSMKYNFCSIRGLDENEFAELRNYLLRLLNIKLDEEKLRYYILLDELF